MSVNSNRQTVLRYVELFNKHDVHGMVGLFHPDAVDHSLPIPPGRDNVLGAIRTLFEAFPDLSLRVEDIIAEGDKIAHRVTLQGTHMGSFMEKPPTETGVEWQVINIISFKGGKMFERWSYGNLKL